jgi:hypothetical protein
MKTTLTEIIEHLTNLSEDAEYDLSQNFFDDLSPIQQQFIVFKLRQITIDLKAIKDSKAQIISNNITM